MKKLLIVSLALVVSACAANTGETVTSQLKVDVDGQVSSWSLSCNYNDYSCNDTSITNARSMYMGDDMYYTCDIAGNLYMSRSTYKTSTNLEKVQGAKCSFKVTKQ